MINFRFHVVSIVAVFLALAIGVVFGSTILNETLVDGLEQRLQDIDDKAERQREANERLKSDIERLDSYLRSNAAFAVDGRLSGLDLLVVATPQVSEQVVADLVALAGVADADTVVVARLDDSLALDDEARVGDLASVLRSTRTGADELRAELWTSIARRSAKDPATDPGLADGDLLEQLADAGFLTLEAGDDLETALAQFGGPSSLDVEISTTSAPLNDTDWLVGLADAARRAELETLAGEVHERDAEADRGVVLGELAVGDQSDVVATVDNLDEYQGRLSVVLAASELDDGVVGHYGFGAGATRSSPELVAP